MGTRLFWLLVSLGCGRIGFDGGHDEDGDGFADALDVCPHLADDQGDGDGDGVGDLCDPEPTIGRQRLALFATLQPDDQPFRIAESPLWSELADAIRNEGPGWAGLELELPFSDARGAMGIDVTALLSPDAQHQLALAMGVPGTPYYFVELNQGPGYNSAGVTFWDGTQFSVVEAQPLTPSGVHTGRVLLQATAWGPPLRRMDFTGGWSKEIYAVTGAAPDYDGGTLVSFNLNNLALEIQWVWLVIAT